MSEYQSLGHMTKINHDDVSHIPHYYLPHHCVEKHDSLTTKLRVVFDASAKTTTGMSLNDILKIGPNVQSDLFSILLRFRKHAVVMIGDIAKMYRQVLIDPSQRNLQLIVWRDNPESELNHFQLNTVTYGTASAAFLATRCLKQISLDNSADYPVESKIISNDFYVDDLLTGSHDESSLITIHQNLVKLLSQAGFDLRKFTSNSATVLHKIKNNSDNSVSKNLNYIITDNQSTKTLGVSWNPILDQFEYNSQITLQICNVSKRTILSLISQIFDPLGLLGPIIIQAKIILQKLWQLQLGWDESIPIDLFTIWQQFYKQLGKVDSIHIPRHIIIPNSVNVQLHGFCDSSERAYGACIYIRSENREGHIQVRLLCAKSRVAPLKVISLPRLELCAAVLLTQLANKVINALDMTIDKIFYWTDSSIVLSWLSAEPYTWQTFVSNRVSEIQQSSQIDEWYHVKSCNNPADIISRGINPTEITQCKLWWQGPEYLSQIEESWPKHAHISNYSRRDSEIPERRNQSKNVLTCTNTFDIFDKFSKLSRLQNVFAYCLRFIKNCRSNRDTRIIGPLTHQEISNSIQILVKLAQSQSFAEDIQSLKKSNRVRPNSKLSSLSPFLDKNNLIRVGGRLKNSNLVYNQKHQVLLPSKHPLTRLIIQDYHTRNLHAGVQTTLSFVRQVYWPINGKSEVKSILRKCIACFKARPLSINQQMGELPQNRITPCRIFSRCGVDYAGPVYIKDGKTRNRKIIKAYICVFICMTSKAIHLELVSELSTEMFLNALKRFVARRGLCTHIYSDNATNFTGANNELLEVNKILEQSSFQNYLRDQKIQWHFIPARSPNFGGLWEAAVKAVKHHLKRVLNNINLTYEEYYTFLTQIEAVLNSRPICPISQDPNDLEALTPGHFIIGDALNAIPEQNVENVSSNRLTRYQHIRQMVEHFWNRWKTEYLHNLQQRHKWKFQQNPQALIGSLVLLKDENSPPLHWPKARIVEVHPGADGLVRVVSVKTINGVVKRALGKICILPI